MSITADTIADHIARTCGVKRALVEPTTPLFSSGLLDSFAMVDLVSFLEKETGSRFRTMDLTLENFDTIDRMLSLAARARD